MPPAARPKRITIGFAGGQVLPARVTPKSLQGLERSLEKDESWHELECEDGSVRLNLATVVYVRVEADEARVGFGA